MRINSRSVISLKGNNITSGVFLHGRSNVGAAMVSEAADKDFIDFKMYIITNFLNPIMDRRFSQVNNNYYNYDYIIERLNGFKNNRTKNDIEFIIKVVNILRYSTNVQISFDEAKKKIYGADKENRILVETSRIVLQAHYEIYNLLFGRPHKTNPSHMKYEIHIINDIKELLKSYPGILFEDIKNRLQPKYGSRFII